MSANRVTMRDVAKEAGVTSAAVSYALSGKRPISEETRRRVEQAIERLGYTPNMAARTLGSARQDSRLDRRSGPSDRGWKPTHVSEPVLL